MKKMDRDPGSKKPGKQVKSLLIGNDLASVSLEQRVAAYLVARKGDKSLGVFAAELGIPKPSLKRYLDCDQSMSLSTLQKIAAALGVKATAILAPPRK